MRAKIRSSRSQLYIRGSLCVDDCSTDGAVTHLGTGVYLNKNPSAIYIDSMEQNISGSLSRVGSRREAKKAVRNLIYQDKSLALAFLHADFCSLLSKGGIIENSTLPPQYLSRQTTRMRPEIFSSIITPNKICRRRLEEFFGARVLRLRSMIGKMPKQAQRCTRPTRVPS